MHLFREFTLLLIKTNRQQKFRCKLQGYWFRSNSQNTMNLYIRQNFETTSGLKGLTLKNLASFAHFTDNLQHPSSFIEYLLKILLVAVFNLKNEVLSSSPRECVFGFTFNILGIFCQELCRGQSTTYFRYIHFYCKLMFSI